jgi:hypothetical protein
MHAQIVQQLSERLSIRITGRLRRRRSRLPERVSQWTSLYRRQRHVRRTSGLHGRRRTRRKLRHDHQSRQRSHRQLRKLHEYGLFVLGQHVHVRNRRNGLRHGLLLGRDAELQHRNGQHLLQENHDLPCEQLQSSFARWMRRHAQLREQLWRRNGLRRFSDGAGQHVLHRHDDVRAELQHQHQYKLRNHDRLRRVVPDHERDVLRHDVQLPEHDMQQRMLHRRPSVQRKRVLHQDLHQLLDWQR